MHNICMMGKERHRLRKVTRVLQPWSHLQAAAGAAYKQVVLPPICVHGPTAPFNPFACWQLFNSQICFFSLTGALKQGIRPNAGFSKDVCRQCPCYPMLCRGPTQRRWAPDWELCPCLLGKHSWHSQGESFKPWAWLSVKSDRWAEGTDEGRNGRMRTNHHLGSVPAAAPRRRKSKAFPQTTNM